jgi:MOSC domain-containing protein YiiM
LEKGVGLVGDAHSGTAKEISILAKEKVDQLTQETGLFFPPGAFAENLLIEGLVQESLVPGTRLKIGRVVLQIEQIGKEPGLQHSYQYRGHSLLPRWGIFAKVIESGPIKNGDEVELLTSSS